MDTFVLRVVTIQERLLFESGYYLIVASNQANTVPGMSVHSITTIIHSPQPVGSGRCTGLHDFANT